MKKKDNESKKNVELYKKGYKIKLKLDRNYKKNRKVTAKIFIKKPIKVDTIINLFD